MPDPFSPAATPPPRASVHAPLDAERRELTERYLPLAHAAARRYQRAWPNHADDLAGDALLALSKAARDYDPERGVKFATFAYLRIKFALNKTATRLDIERRAWNLMREYARSILH